MPVKATSHTGNSTRDSLGVGGAICTKHTGISKRPAETGGVKDEVTAKDIKPNVVFDTEAPMANPSFLDQGSKK